MSGSTTEGAFRARLVQLLMPAVEATGHDLEDVSVSPAGKRRVVRVVVDCDAGVTLDDVAQVSRALSDVLDAAEVDEPGLLGGAYVLEVSSPGVDRPLTERRHWRRNVGRLVTAHLVDGTSVTGRVLSADDDGIKLDTEQGSRHLAHGDVVRGDVQVEFSRPGAEPAYDAYDADDPDNTDDTEVDA